MKKQTVTVLITTKDRKGDLARALSSTLQQKGVDEILVFDDGSSDGTSDFVAKTFGCVRVERSSIPLGIVAARNRAMQLAVGGIVITIDDDCEFQSPNTVVDTIRDFEDDRVGAVAIPHINVRDSLAVIGNAPSAAGMFATSEFTGCANAIRRDVFLGLGGFNRLLWRQCEEYDFCTRLLASGFDTICGRATPVLHYGSVHNSDSLAFQIARSHILYAWCNVPFPYVLPHLIGTMVKVASYGAKRGNVEPVLRGFSDGLRVAFSCPSARMPVDVSAYHRMRKLRRSGPVRIADR